MTTIAYKINNQTSREIIAPDWATAQSLLLTTIQEENEQLRFWSIIAVVTNNDGTITMSGIDANGNPVKIDESGNIVPYVDPTLAVGN